MSDVSTGADAPSGGAVAPVNVQTDTGPLSIRDAAAQFRARADKQAAEPVQETPDKTEQPRVKGRFASADAPQESPEGDNAAAVTEQPPGEDQGQADPAPDEPSIEPPRSWTKEEKEAFRLLPPEYQQSVAERERKREADIRKGHDEVAEQRKAIEAERKATEQARQQYEQAAQNALQVLQQQTASEFADIKTQADVNTLAEQDPFRFAKWQAHQMQIQSQAREVEALNRQRQEQQAKTFETWSQEQDDKFTKKFSEFTDKDKAGKLRETIVNYLTEDIGVPKDKLPNLWNTDLFRDAMFQEVVYDASRFRAAQKAAKAAVLKPVPQVQRPGVAQGKGEARQADIAALTQKLDGARTVRDQITAAAALRAARRAAAQ